MIFQKDWDFVSTNNMKCEIYFVFWRLSEFYELCDDWVSDMILYFLSWKRTIHICANCSMPGFFNLVEFFGICMNFNLKNKEDASHRMELPTFPHQYSEILPGCTLSSSENLILPSILTRNLIYQECGNFHSL